MEVELCGGRQAWGVTTFPFAVLNPSLPWTMVMGKETLSLLSGAAAIPAESHCGEKPPWTSSHA